MAGPSPVSNRGMGMGAHVHRDSLVWSSHAERPLTGWRKTGGREVAPTAVAAARASGGDLTHIFGTAVIGRSA